MLHPDLLNPRLLEAQYAVRGELYLKAEELKKTRDIIYTNGEGGDRGAAVGGGGGGLLRAPGRRSSLFSGLLLFHQHCRHAGATKCHHSVCTPHQISNAMHLMCL